MTVCVAAWAPGGLNQAAVLCVQVRSRQPGVRVVVGRWESEPDPAAEKAPTFRRGRGSNLDSGGDAPGGRHVSCCVGRGHDVGSD